MRAGGSRPPTNISRHQLTGSSPAPGPTFSGGWSIPTPCTGPTHSTHQISKTESKFETALKFPVLLSGTATHSRTPHPQHSQQVAKMENDRGEIVDL